MRYIACAILSVGLCFYQIKRLKLDRKNPDLVAELFAVAAAAIIIFKW